MSSKKCPTKRKSKIFSIKMIILQFQTVQKQTNWKKRESSQLICTIIKAKMNAFFPQTIFCDTLCISGLVQISALTFLYIIYFSEYLMLFRKNSPKNQNNLVRSFRNICSLVKCVFLFLLFCYFCLFFLLASSQPLSTFSYSSATFIYPLTFYLLLFFCYF